MSQVSLSEKEAVRRFVARYAKDPVRFAIEVLGYRLWLGQKQILEAVVSHPRVAVRSGHKVGKSTAAAILALWWVLFRPRARAVITSVKFDQITDTVWRELRHAHLNSKFPIGGTINDTPRGGFHLPNGGAVLGRTAAKDEGMAGLSGADLLFIVDEASGIREEIFEVIEGNRAGGARVILLGNPTQTSGTFFEAFHDKREFWKRIHLPSTKTPNAQFPDATDLHIPGLANADWVEEKRKEWARTPALDVRVFGNFPRSSADSVVSLADVDDARGRFREPSADDPGSVATAKGDLCLGVDVAEFGDDETVIQPIRGNVAYPPIPLPKQRVSETARQVLRVAKELRRGGERVTVMVDGIGIGAGVVAPLVESEEATGWLEVHSIRVGETSDDPDKYYNLRTQLWFGAAAWLRDEGALPNDSRLEGELLAAKFQLDSRGRVQLEPKKATKRSIARSPDRADAFCLAVYRGRRGHAEELDRLLWSQPSRSEARRLADGL